ncbi:hypothetical protein CAOG_03649 [Capsaspora owczarzaki ATCC 30864]|uniref:Uncharacterized protein n=1 Tax=Capsaspora owczarzaki (strain ATCC 30864) TaxID=595528 RepID=A0A0D2X2K9_CAPO3|nr:hypothetical protein CAOG_03649 [Capsaspora owczarzaki ATCC 30864]KJE92739.1 hypothetical protein CAOG_003649 [Capsaspora owczarzaki ATCC 30864]|eukprot:XP_004363377.2 hypothetical protein CAOG_03649 [Capsaspora owczarzaki ATCC 30864]
MAFASSGSAASGLPDLESSGRRHVLASIDRDGTVVVSRISFAADGNLVVTSILHVPTDNVIKSFPRHRLAWSPASIAHPGLCLVVAYGSLCTLWKVDDILAANNGNPVQATRAQLQPNWVTFIRSDQKQQLINDLAFSADGTVLLTCGGESVQFWRTETGQLLHDWAPHGKQTVLSVLPMGNGTNSVDQLAHTQAQMMPLLVTASSLNHEIKLWRSRDLQLLQTLRFDSPPATTTGVPLGLQLALDPTFCFVSTGLLLVADQHRKSLYALGLAATGSHGSPALSYRFSTLTEFHLTDALISFIVARSAVTFDVTSPQEMNVHFDFQLIVKDPKVIQQLAVRYRPVSRPHATAIRALKASAPLPSSAAPVQHPPASTTPPSLEHSAAPSPVAAAATASGAAGPTAAVSAPHNVGGDGKLPAWLTTSSGATASSSLPASLTDSTERGLNLSGANTVRPTRQPNGAGTGKGFATGSAVAAPVSEALLHQMRDEIHQSQEHTLNLVQQLIAQQQKQAEKDREDAAQLAAQTTIRAISSEFQKLIVPLVQQTVSASVKQTVTELVPSIAAQAANLVAESATTTALANKPLAENVAKLIASSLRNPIQEAFRSTFQQNVIPALDRALQQTMQQVNATFDQGTRDYLQQLYALDGAKTGAALNSQQLQAFAVSIQQSVQQASAECQRSTTAAVDVSLARVQKDLREIVVSRKSDRKERSDRSSSSANQSSAALSASSLDGAAASAMQQQGATPLPASASATALAPAPAATSDKERLWQHIAELVAAQEFDKAFSEALGATDLAVLMRLCSGIPVATIFGQSPVPLSPAILLSLVQQLSFDLSRDIETKISYLQPAVLALDSSNSMVQRHAPVVLKSANRKLKEWLVLPQSATSSLSASIKLMVMLIERLLERCEAPGAEGNARPL